MNDQPASRPGSGRPATLPGPPSDDAAWLPAEATVRLAPGVRFVAPGVLATADPLRLLRLTARAPAVDELAAGKAVLASRLGRRTSRRLVDGGVLLTSFRDDRHATFEEIRRRVVIVVPVRDRSAELARSLPSLVAQAPVVVVDDASRDASAVAEVARRSGARLVRRSRNGGPGSARNTGLAVTDAEVVAFVDSDVRVGVDWLARLLPQLDDPRVALVAPRVRSIPGPSRRERYEFVHGPLDLGPRSAAVHPRGAVAYVPSAAWVLRRAALPEGFTRGLRVAEDVDAVWRLHGAGWGVRYRAEVEVWHAPRPTVWTALQQRRDYAQGAARLAAAHPGGTPPLRLAPWSAVLTAGTLSVHPFGLVAAAAAAGIATVKISRTLPPSPDLTTYRRGAVAARLVGRGAAATARGVPRAVTRAWPPLLPLLTAVSPRAGAVLAAAWAVDVVASRQGLPRGTPVGHRGVAPPERLPLIVELCGRALDDLAYSAGLWRGAWRARSMGAVLPRSARASSRRTS